MLDIFELGMGIKTKLLTIGGRRAEIFKQYEVAKVFWDTLYTMLISNEYFMGLVLWKLTAYAFQNINDPAPVIL